MKEEGQFILPFFCIFEPIHQTRILSLKILAEGDKSCYDVFIKQNI